MSSQTKTHWFTCLKVSSLILIFNSLDKRLCILLQLNRMMKWNARCLWAQKKDKSQQVCVCRAEDIVSFSFEQFVSQYNTTYCIFCYLYVIQSVIVDIALHMKEWKCQWITCRPKKIFEQLVQWGLFPAFWESFFVLLLDGNRQEIWDAVWCALAVWLARNRPWLTAWRNLNTFNKCQDKECVWSKGWKRNSTVVLCTKMMSGLHLRKHELAA